MRGFRGRGPSGREAPNAENSASSPTAPSMPSPMPAAEAVTPMTSDSISTERRTCRGVAPSARSSDSSRTRCPSTMLKVLEMMNVLTNSTTKAKVSRIVCSGPMKNSKKSPNSSAASSELITSAPTGRAASMRSRTSSRSAPGSARTSISLNRPS